MMFNSMVFQWRLSSFEGNQTYINPPYEAVSEFRVDSSTFDPQYGLGQGAVTFNMASGTNDLHGDAFEILRNQLFDSDGFFPVRYSADGNPAPPIDQQNNYGFTVGGPVIIPKLYNGRNRTFFHFSCGLVQAESGADHHWNRADPGHEERRLQQFRGFYRNAIPIYDPQTGQPFPGNIIPQSRFSPLAASLLPSIPNPDRAGMVFGLAK